MSSVIRDSWFVARLPDGQARIFPDGCQDVIWVHPRAGRPYWKIATLDTRLRVLSGFGGAALLGSRLAPGAQIAPELMQNLDPDNPESGRDAIAHFCAVPEAVEDWLAEARAAPGQRVGLLARKIGVSARTLQRQIRAETGQAPLFWLRLLRLRAALAEIQGGAALAEAAFGAGFSDQAHFTREAATFYGASPRRLLQDDRALALILAPGL